MYWKRVPDSIQVVYLDNNQITEMNLKGSPSSMYEIVLSNNKITRINWKGSTSELASVNLSKNKITKINWQDSINIMYLDLSWNQISKQDLEGNPINSFDRDTQFQTFDDMIKYNIEFLTGKRINTFYYGHGFFTVNGQASECTHPKIKQKSHLVGYLEQNNKTENLIEYLKSNDKLYFAVTRLDKNNKTISYSTFPNSNYDLTIQYYNNKWNVFRSHRFIYQNFTKVFVAVKEYCKDNVEDELMKFYNSI